LVDSLRFGGDLTERMTFHPSDTATVLSSSILTFEPLEWFVADGIGSIQEEFSKTTQGSGAMSVDPVDWTRVESRQFSTNELVGVSNKLSFDVHIPDLPAHYDWLGQLNVFLDCPQAGLWNTFLGHQPLQILFDDEFNRIEFDLTDDLVAVFAGEYDECRFALEFSTNAEFGPFVVDRGGFVQ
jgi:hypothetical protein